jgi:hypothetical protein
MDAPQEEFYTEHQTETLILFKIISRRSWDELQSWHRAFPGSRIEHVQKGTGIFVLIVGTAGESGELAP